MCHLVLFMPLFALPVFWLLPWPLATAIYACVLALSAWLYYVIIKLMHSPSKIGLHTLFDADGTIVQTDGLRGLARIGRELWKVESRTPLVENQQVRVIGRYGFVLQVADASSPGTRPASPAASDHQCAPGCGFGTSLGGLRFLRHRNRSRLS